MAITAKIAQKDRRLEKLGVTSSMQVPFLVPSRYTELSTITHLSEIQPNTSFAIQCTVISEKPFKPKSKKGFVIEVSLPCSHAHPQQQLLRLMFFAYPPAKQITEFYGQEVRMQVKSLDFHAGDTPLLIFQEQLPTTADYPYPVIGVYPGSRGLQPGVTRSLVVDSLKDSDGMRLGAAASRLMDELAPYTQTQVLSAWGQSRCIPNAEKTSLMRMIRAVHFPAHLNQAELASQGLRDMIALAYLIQAVRSKPRTEKPVQVVIGDQMLYRRLNQLPKQLSPTDDQLQAVRDALKDLSGGHSMHRLLSGDVGTGKTLVFGLVARLIADAGHRALILLPSAPMADQVYAELSSWWPDTQQDAVLVTGATSKIKMDQQVQGKRILIGTTALNARLEHLSWRPDLVVVDEQQRFSVRQRQQLLKIGGHLLEATATCLPRTLAQVHYGLTDISRLNKPCVAKNFYTTLHDQGEPESMDEVSARMAATLAAGDQVLIVFASKEKEGTGTHNATPDNGQAQQIGQSETEAAEPPKLFSISEGFPAFARRYGEDRVVQLHGSMKAEDKQQSLDAMKSGQADVLCATTAAEVGLNIPRLRLVIIMNPERLGLVTMHQLRGRGARNGGDAWCMLVADKKRLKSDALDRLSALCKTTDGFRLAEMDFALRGMGDLDYEAISQNGKHTDFLLPPRAAALQYDHFQTASSMLKLLADN